MGTLDNDIRRCKSACWLAAIAWLAITLNVGSAHAVEFDLACEAKDGTLITLENPPKSYPWSPQSEKVRAQFSFNPNGVYEGVAHSNRWRELESRPLPATLTPSEGSFMIFEPSWGGANRPRKLLKLDLRDEKIFKLAVEAEVTKNDRDGVLVTRYTCVMSCNGKQVGLVPTKTCPPS
jgi:hypothetical protein